MARLLCFHHAGGAASEFKGWARILPPSIHLVAVQLPGREQRQAEPLRKDLVGAAAEVADALHGLTDLPLFAFGHSLGAILAYESLRILQRDGGRQPMGLAVAACTPPHLRGNGPPLHGLPDDALVAELSRYENIPSEVLAHEELRALILPRIRADFEMLETYHITAPVPLDCPLMILAAPRDRIVDDADATAWNLYCSGKSEFHALDGGHFFVQEHRNIVAELLVRFMIRQLDVPDLASRQQGV